MATFGQILSRQAAATISRRMQTRLQTCARFPLQVSSRGLFQSSAGGINPAIKPANIDSMSFQDAVTYMWEDLDKGNRLEMGKDGFELNMQAKGRSDGDKCTQPLFKSVNLSHPFWSMQTTQSFMQLLDNYERTTGAQETVDVKETKEMRAYLDSLCNTSVMLFAFEYVMAHGIDPRVKSVTNIADFRDVLLYEIWFEPYRRFKTNDSSGFEHVFVGEESRGKITGLHNWVQYYLEEVKGSIDYQGWAGKQDQDNTDGVNLVTVRFAWNGDGDADVEIKPLSTFLCGSTLELEMGLLTMAFLAGNQNGATPIKLGNLPLQVVCHAQTLGHKGRGPKIASAFLEPA